MDYSYLDQFEFKESYLVQSSPEVMDFYLENVKCAKCLSRVESIKSANIGVGEVELNLGSHVARVTLAEGGDFASAAKAFEAMGHKAHPIASRSQVLQLKQQENRRLLTRVGVSAAIAGNIMLFAISNYAGANPSWARLFDIYSAVIFLGVLFYSAMPFYKSAWSALKARTASIDFPIVVSIIIGSALSYYHVFVGHGDVYFDSIAMFVFLILASRYLLYRFQEHLLSPSLFRDFMNLGQVQRLKGNERENVLPKQINLGDVLVLKEGEKLPVDGVLLSEQAFFDNSMLTGESLPQSFVQNSECFAGSQCLSENIQVKATSRMRNSRLGLLLEKVEDQLLTKTPLISLTDKIAHYFTLVILTIGTLFVAYYYSIDSAEAISRSLALVVLACPCALAFATPLSQSLALAKLAKNGILVKSAEVIERMNQAKAVIFDKTGTLSQSQLKISGWPMGEASAQTKSIVYALAIKSRHPMAQSIANSLSGFANDRIKLESFSEEVGVGVSAKINGKTFSLTSAPQDYSSKSSVALYCGDKCLTVILLSEKPQLDSRKTLEQLRARGLEAYIISGDGQEAVLKMAEELNIPLENSFARMTPEQKQEFLIQHPMSVMVGDGANDLLAITKSHVSVAVMGSLESSLRAADVYITKPGVGAVFELFNVASESMKVIKRNLIISLIYNSLGVTAALLGYISPLLAAVLMPLSSCVVIVSSIYGTNWLRKYKASQVGT